MTNIILVLHVLAAIAIVVLVLLQQGRGADMGAAFGGGSQTLFGARGSANFLSRITAVLAAVFFTTSMVLAVLYGRGSDQLSVTDEVVTEQPATPSAADIPAIPGEAQPDTGSSGDIPAVPGEAQPEANAGDMPAIPESPAPGPAAGPDAGSADGSSGQPSPQQTESK